MIKTRKASSEPKNEDVKPQKSSPENANQERVHRSIPKSLILFIPENLDFDYLLEKNPPNFSYQKDKFIYITYLITDIPTRNKDKDYIFVPLYSSLLKTKVHNYNKYLDYLVVNGVLVKDGQYIVGKKSKAFAFTQTYKTKVKEVVITYPTLIKSISCFKNIKTSRKTNFICQDISELNYLTKWYNPKFTIDLDSAVNWIENQLEIDLANPTVHNSIQKFNYRFIPISKIDRREFNIVIDKTAGRLHSPLTQIKGELRQFLKYNGEELYSIDIVNSQPYLITALLNEEKFIKNKIFKTIQNYNPKTRKGTILNTEIPYYVSKIGNPKYRPENVNQFIKSVSSGKFYEEFGILLKSEGLLSGSGKELRKNAKIATFSSIFSPNNSISYNESLQSFKKVFPDVYNLLSLIKFGKGNHRTLSCTLQNFEANLILHRACKIISRINSNIPIFTLHDSIITTKEHIMLVKKVMKHVLTKAIGLPPVLKIEQL
ncbi:MAG: hypothetical protein ACI93P_002412 [bacterium]|jgi:hypothetical protein